MFRVLYLCGSEGLEDLNEHSRIVVQTVCDLLNQHDDEAARPRRVFGKSLEDELDELGQPSIDPRFAVCEHDLNELAGFDTVCLGTVAI